MTSSATFTFNPAAANLTLMAFSRIGIRRTEITAQHMADADIEANLVQVGLGNRQPNLWRNELYERTLTESQGGYDLPTNFIAIRNVYLTTTSGGVSTDRVMWPLSTMEYDNLPNKTLEAPPQSYFINKLMTPTISFWPVPDGTATYTANIRILTQTEDASLRSGTTLDLPYRALDVFVAGLAHRLSRIYAPDKEMVRKQDYLDAWADMTTTDNEDNIALIVAPDLAGYYRR